jgi:hypothetical protein
MSVLINVVILQSFIIIGLLIFIRYMYADYKEQHQSLKHKDELLDRYDKMTTGLIKERNEALRKLSNQNK